MRIPKKLRKEKNNKNNAIDNESLIASKLNMTLTKSSGSCVTDKGDMYSEKFLLELKQTKNESLGIKREWINKIKREAEYKNKFWALYILFTDDKNIINNEAVLISRENFEYLRECLYDRGDDCECDSVF